MIKIFLTDEMKSCHYRRTGLTIEFWFPIFGVAGTSLFHILFSICIKISVNYHLFICTLWPPPPPPTWDLVSAGWYQLHVVRWLFTHSRSFFLRKRSRQSPPSASSLSETRKFIALLALIIGLFLRQRDFKVYSHCMTSSKHICRLKDLASLSLL